MSAHPVLTALEKIGPQQIIERAAVAGRRLKLIANQSPVEARQMLEAELRRVVLVCDQVKTLLSRLIAEALAYARVAYASEGEHLGRIYSSTPMSDVDPGKVCVLVGPAGTGKSALLAALERILGGPTVMHLPGHTLPLELICRVSSNTRGSANAIFLEFCNPANENPRDAIKSAGLWRQTIGTCLCAVDELQFLTQSAQANTKVAKVLLGMSMLPMPSVIACNYSLLRKVMRRPPEERQRYLASPAILLPESPGSDAWIGLLKEYQVVLESYTGFQLVNEQLELWNLSVGNKRILVRLIGGAFQASRHERRKMVMSDIVAYYRSFEFAHMRNEVEEVISRSISRSGKESDLFPPFSIDPTREQQYTDSIKAARSAKVSEAARKSSLSTTERETLAQFSPLPQADASQPRPTRRPPRTLAGLLAAGQAVTASANRQRE